MSDNTLSQPTALVTGGSRGIGRAIATRLAADGYHIVVNFHSQAGAAHETVKTIEDAGGSALAVRGDVADATDRKALIEAATDVTGRLDVLVNNAGITSPGRVDLLDTCEESWDVVLDTNLKGPFFLAQAAARQMIELVRQQVIPNGKIINISSISAYAVSHNRPEYCIAKAGMQMMTWLFASRLAEEGVLVYEVCPGVIASDMTAPVKEKYDRLIDEGLAPMRRWGQPEDVAGAVAALVAEALPFCTGERINVDGGFHIRRL
jgi:NAD(P)-dependent dehydrogenase (short-subunit alcohol dehydrogenase family)